jgi:hypothetical protein
MKSAFLFLALLVSGLLGGPVFSQTEKKPDSLGLPGDNLDLYAVLDLFQKSKTIEDFEKSLNLEKTGINNLDLNLDKKVDFIKVVTKKNGDDFTFILQDDVSEKETQDVAVILVSKDKDKKVTMQIVGDPALYGKNYIVEPKAAAPAATANPGYTGTEPVKAPAPVNTTTVVVESSPVVVYMYSPTYVPYVPPYHYAYHPPYFAAFTVMAVGVYHANHYNNHYHGGGYGHTTVVVNNNNYNNYNNTRNTSNTVNHNTANGNYNRNNANTANRPANTGANTGNKAANTGVNTGNKAANTGVNTGNKAANTGANTGNKAANTGANTGNKAANTGANTTNKPSNTSGNKPSASPSASPSTRSSASPSTSPNKSGGGSRGGGGGSRGGRR